MIRSLERPNLTNIIKENTKEFSAILGLGTENDWRRKWQPTPVLMPGKFYGQRSLVGYNTCSHKELDMTERLK